MDARAARQYILQKLLTELSLSQGAILTLPRTHPLRGFYVQTQGIARLGSYTMSKNLDDLDQSILHLTEAVLLPPPSLPWDEGIPNSIEIFFSLTLALSTRAHVSNQPEDVTRSIIYLRYLHVQSLEVFNVSPDRVTALLADALGLQVALKLGDAKQSIEEMATLCLELLKSDMSTASISDLIIRFARIAKTRFGRLAERPEPSGKVIECLREANARLPDSYEVSIAFAWSLYERLRISYSTSDYEEGIAILDKVIRAPGDRPTEHQKAALNLASMYTLNRTIMSGKPEYLEEAIYRTSALLGKTSLKNTHRHDFTGGLAALRERRFGDPGDLSVLQALPEASIHPCFRDLTASLINSELNGENQGKHMRALLSAGLNFHRITDDAEIEDAIKYFRLLLASSGHGSDMASRAATALGTTLRRAFSRNKKIEYLNEAISVYRNKFNDRGVLQDNFSVIQGLIESLHTRLNLLYRREDFHEIIQLYSTGANDEHVRTPDRFQLSCEWARFARDSRHPSASAAYDSAISLMQDSLTFAPTLDIQHSRLFAMRDNYGTLPLDYASYHISVGQLPQAVETLERGRALIWSEMRGLRTSSDQIRAIDSNLADKFAAINRDLETFTLKLSYSSNAHSIDDARDARMDPFGNLVVQQRKLLEDRNALISQIQALPGLETFLKSPSFDNIHSAASRGPVIILNHCKWRSDIIILVRNSLPSLITTSDDFFDRAINLRNKLLSARKEGLDSDQFRDALSFVLKELYDFVGKPVIQRLNELGVPEQSRVWWCPTSVFCSLPLHAMGPILSDGRSRYFFGRPRYFFGRPRYFFGRPRYFLDLYIPSYTPTLSSLIESNNPGSHSVDKPSILLVSQPETLPGAYGEMQTVQAASAEVTTLISAKATPTAVLEGLRDHRFAHFACHGKLEPGKPFDASFQLHEDKHLFLLDIVRSRLPEAEFAFLSACHTAELTKGSIVDEALHLAAAMQYCGFRSVVGTTWEMADTDGRVVAKDFYKQVFSGGPGVCYYERTAEALRDAVKTLRGKKRMSLERWVTFVHYGA